MIVAEITEQKSEELKGSSYADGVMFNPVRYGDKWVISLIEAQYLKAVDIVNLLDFNTQFVDED